MADSYDVILVTSLLLCVVASTSGQRATLRSGYRLPQDFQYLALASKLVRPDQTYNVFVSLYTLPYPVLRVRAVLSSNEEEYASSMTTFTEIGTKNVQLKVPLSVQQGNHKLIVEGFILDGAGQPVFKNETVVYFQTKYVPIFITTDHPLYVPEQTVYFRVVGTTQNLQVQNGQLNIFMRDAKGIAVRRWMQKQLNIGVYEDTYVIPYPINDGNWTIEVHAFGYIYRHQFNVRYFWQRQFDVKLLVPNYVFNTDFAIAGTIEGEHTSNGFVESNAEITARIRNPDGSFMDGEIRKSVHSIVMVGSFEITLKELKDRFGDINGKHVFLKGWLTAWFWLDTKNATAVVRIVEDGIRVKALGKTFQAFKPGTPFNVNLIVERTDGTPYIGPFNRQLVIQRVHTEDSGRVYAPDEEKVLIPDDSVVTYQVVPRPDDRRILITAWHVITQQKVELTYYRYWSDHGHFMALITSTAEPSVDEYIVFTVRTNFYTDKVDYLVMSKGNVLFGSSLTMRTLQRTFSLAVSRDMAPAARIVIYTMRDGEILTDSLTFYVKDTKLTQAELVINAGKDFRGEKMEMIVYGAPGGFLFTQAINYDYFLKGGITFVNEEKVTRELLSFNTGDRDNIDGPQHHVWYYDDERFEGSIFFNQPTTGIDHITTFNASGLVILTDLNITVPDEISLCNRTLGFGRCLNGDCFDLSNTCNGVVDCTFDGFDEMQCPSPAMPDSRSHFLNDLSLYGTHMTENDWLWKNIYVKFTKQTEITVEVPDTDCPFYIAGFIMHPTEGLSVINTPVEYDTTRMFTMSTEAPEVLKRGEQLGIRCAIFNYWDQELEVIVMLHGNGDYRFVVVEDMGIVRSYSPKTVSGDIQTFVELPAGTWRYVYFPIVATIESGEITVSLTAYSTLRVDYEEITIEVIYDAIASDDATPYLVDLVNKGSVFIPEFDIPTPERFFVPEQRQLIYVPGSNRITVNVWGDMGWPGFWEENLSLDNTVAVPHDQADGYMYDFAVNLQTLQFLQGTNALTREAEEPAIAYMISILSRQYSYMQDDGSFKMFRRADKPCLWLTSFILQSLHAAHASEWEPHLYIESSVLNKIAMWVIDQFNTETGRFEEISDTIYDRHFLPTSIDIDGNEQEWHIPVTAHVVITLSTTTRLTGDAKSAAHQVKQLAAEYLADKVPFLTDPLELAMTAYALLVANHDSRFDAFRKLKPLQRQQSDFVYWSKIPIMPNTESIVNTRIIMGVREKDPYNSHALRATAYALMLYLEYNEWEASVPIMKWLHSQPNTFLGWDTSQDQLLVLKALTDFARRETNRDIFQMQIRVEATKPTEPKWEHVFHINKSNFAQVQSVEMDYAWGQIRAYANGTGYANIHMTSDFHFEHEFMLDNPQYDAFALEVQKMTFYGRNGSHLSMELCLSWVRTDISPEAGMTFMRINLPTGYVVDRDVIQGLYLAGVPGLKRVRYRENKLIIFFEYITTDWTCFAFHANRWFPVANMSIPNLIEIWEYGETRIQTNYLYRVFTLFHSDICHVCGSFQCPYCPYYNAGPTLHNSFTVVYIIYGSLLASLLVWIQQAGLFALLAAEH